MNQWVRTVCASVSVALATLAVFLNRSAAGDRLVDSALDWAWLFVVSAVAGAWLLRHFIAPVRWSWFWPPLGGLLTAVFIMMLALLPDSLLQMMSGNATIIGVLLVLLLAGFYTLAVAGPVFVIGALVLHGVFRALSSRAK